MTRKLVVVPNAIRDNEQIEQCIKYLQSHGYEVFQKSAQVHAYVTSSIDSLQLASYNSKEPNSFIEYTQRHLSSKLGNFLLREGHTTFEVLPPTPDDPTWMRTQTQMRLSLKYWNDDRKEFRR